MSGPIRDQPRNAADTEEGAGLQSEVERLRAELEAVQSSQRERRHLRTRSIISALLVVLVSLSVVAATTAAWLHETLLNTETFIETIEPVFSDPAVTDAIGAYLTEQTFLALGVQERLDATLSQADAYLEEQVLGLIDVDPRIESRLAAVDRPRFSDLAGPLVSAAEGSVRDAVQSYLASEEFQNTFTALATSGHEGAVALLRGNYAEVPNVVIDTDSVRLDLTPAVAGTIQALVEGGVGIVGFDPPAGFTVPVDSPETARAWLADTFDQELAPDFAQITVMSTTQLEGLQGTVRAFDRAVWMLVILVVALTVATVWLAPRKTRALVQLAIGVVVALALGNSVVDRLQQAVVAAFGDPAGREVARIFIVDTVTSLRSLGLLIVWAAVAIGVVSFAVGRSWHRSAATWISDLLSAEPETTQLGRFVASHVDGLRAGGIAVAVAILATAGIGFVSVIVLGLLLASYLWALTVLNAGTPEQGSSAEPADDEHRDTAAGVEVSGLDDLTVIAGIGDAVAALLGEHGITSLSGLAECSTEEIQAILDSGGSRFKICNPTSWPSQARLIAEASDVAESDGDKPRSAAGLTQESTIVES